MQKIPIKVKFVIRFWLPFFLWALVIFSFSSYPTIRASELHWKEFIIKKSAHVVEYFIFSLLLFRALINSGVTTGKSIKYTIISAFIYGLSDEFHQQFTPGREAKIRDVMFDFLGSLIFIKTYELILMKNDKLKNLAKMIQLVRNK